MTIELVWAKNIKNYHNQHRHPIPVTLATFVGPVIKGLVVTLCATIMQNIVLISHPGTTSLDDILMQHERFSDNLLCLYMQYFSRMC